MEASSLGGRLRRKRTVRSSSQERRVGFCCVGWEVGFGIVGGIASRGVGLVRLVCAFGGEWCGEKVCEWLGGSARRGR